MSKTNRLRHLEDALAPRAVRPLPTIVEVTVSTHAEYLEYQALRASGRRINLPKGAGPIVNLTVAEYKRLFAPASKPTARRPASLSPHPPSR